LEVEDYSFKRNHSDLFTYVSQMMAPQLKRFAAHLAMFLIYEFHSAL